MKLAISNIAWCDDNNEKVYDIMWKHGFSGLEIAPTRIVAENPYDNIEDAKMWYNKIQEKYGFVIPSMQSIWYGRTEKLFGSSEERNKLLQYTKKAIDFAESIGCKNLVFGCPKNRNISDESNKNIANDFFGELATYAHLHNTVLSMEANPAIYNTNYINTTKEAIDIVELINNEGFKVNLDVGTMVENNESISILQGKVGVINHVHISEPGLKKIEERDLHKELFSILKKEKYEGYISIEMNNKATLDDIDEICLYLQELSNTI